MLAPYPENILFLIQVTFKLILLKLNGRATTSLAAKVEVFLLFMERNEIPHSWMERYN